MAYTSPSISNYNDNPPPDDGTESTANEITWAKIKEELPDPIKTYADAINTNVAAAFADIFSDVGFSVIDTSSAPSTNTWTQIAWTTEVKDPGNNFASNAYTCPTDGVYQFNAALAYATMADDSGPTEIAIYLNGSLYRAAVGAYLWLEDTAAVVGVQISISDTFSAGDVITVWTRHQGGATENFLSTSKYNFFNGHRVANLT